MLDLPQIPSQCRSLTVTVKRLSEARIQEIKNDVRMNQPYEPPRELSQMPSKKPTQKPSRKPSRKPSQSQYKKVQKRIGVKVLKHGYNLRNRNNVIDIQLDD